MNISSEPSQEVSPASRCVAGEERAPGEGGLECDVGVVFLRGAEAVQEDDGGEFAAPADRGDPEARAVDAQVYLFVGELTS